MGLDRRGSYSAIAEADLAFALWIMTRWLTGATAVDGQSPAATDVVVPLAVEGRRGMSSLVTVRNTGADEAATVRMALIDPSD